MGNVYRVKLGRIQGSLPLGFFYLRGCSRESATMAPFSSRAIVRREAYSLPPSRGAPCPRSCTTRVIASVYNHKDPVARCTEARHPMYGAKLARVVNPQTGTCRSVSMIDTPIGWLDRYKARRSDVRYSDITPRLFHVIINTLVRACGASIQRATSFSCPIMLKTLHCVREFSPELSFLP